jgi:hypothetical protein
MLVWVEDVVIGAVCHDGGSDDVFKQFAADAGKGDGAIVGCCVTGAFLVDGGDKCISPF